MSFSAPGFIITHNRISQPVHNNLAKFLWPTGVIPGLVDQVVYSAPTMLVHLGLPLRVGKNIETIPAPETFSQGTNGFFFKPTRRLPFINEGLKQRIEFFRIFSWQYC